MLSLGQEWVLVRGTIRSNICLGLHVSDKTLNDMIVQMGMEEDLAALPEGLETMVGEGGVGVSRSLQQRIAISRLLLRDAPLVIVDEPTSAQSAEQSMITVSNLTSLKRKQAQGNAGEGYNPFAERTVTVLFATQSLELSKTFEEIVVLDRGSVLEYGPRDRLLKRKGPYYKMVRATSGLSVTSRGKASITAERLKQVWMFCTTPLSALTKVAAAFDTRVVSSGEYIFEQGADADAMYFVVRGCLEQTITKRGGDEPTIQDEKLVVGDVIGAEEALIDDNYCWEHGLRSAALKSYLLELPQDKYTELVDSDVALGGPVRAIVQSVLSSRSPGRLRAVWPLFGASAPVLERLVQLIRLNALEPNDVLFNDEDEIPNDSFTIIAHGSCKLRSRRPGSTDVIERVLGKDKSFGEIHLIRHLPAANSIRDTIFD
eukprot:5570033-Prymnesium_polylepis.1